MKLRLQATLAAVTLVGLSTFARAEPLDVDPAVLNAEAERIAVVEQATRTAVAVMAPGGAGGGSGVVISPDGYALSNFHVTKPCGDWMKCGMADGRLYDAVLVGVDPVGDVALIKLLGRDDFPYAELADSDQVRVGDWAFAVGNPFLLATDFKPTVSYGIISGVHRYQYPAGTLLEYADCIQTDAAINPGNSGGPLFDAQGRVIGINGRGSFEKRGRVNVGVGYAISINQIKKFMGHLRGGRIADHASLGAVVSTQPNGRVAVSDILEDSDAFRRGLRYGDEVVKFGGRSIDAVNAFKNVLGIFPKGWRVPLSYRRNGETHDILVRLEGVHGVEELIAKVQGPSALPAPKPDETPKGTPEGEKGKDEKPGEKRPSPHGAGHGERKMPEAVKALYEQRHGFANYYFNTFERDRVWKAFVASSAGDFSNETGEWILAGELISGGECVIRLSDETLGFKAPGGVVAVPANQSLAGIDAPTGSGGLLAAMAMWRRMLIHGPEQFGAVEYAGLFPILGEDKPCDAFDATSNGVESRFYFDTDSGELRAIELVSLADADPCELYFSGYQEVEGRRMPRRLEVRHGDELYSVYIFNQITFGEEK